MANASKNPFALLVDDDNDPASLLAAHKKVAEKPAPSLSRGTKKPTIVQPKLPSKPLPPAEAARMGKGGSGSAARQARGGSSRNGADEAIDAMGKNQNENSRHGGGGGGKGRRSNGGDDGKRPQKREFDRHSSDGRSNEVKRDGYGRGNWGIPTDQVPMKKIDEFNNSTDLHFWYDKDIAEMHKDAQNESEGKQSEDKEMTLDEYKKSQEEKRKALQAMMRHEERKVEVDKEFESMLRLSSKKKDDSTY